MLKDAKGRLHPDTAPLRDDTLWANILRPFLKEPLLLLEAFSELRKLAQEVRALQARYAAVISPQKDLPEEYFKALLRFRFFLDKVIEAILCALETSLPSSPQLRHFVVRDEGTDPKSTAIHAHINPTARVTKAELKLLWLTILLSQDRYDTYRIGLVNTVDELERLLQAEPEASKLISAKVAAVIGDLSIVTQCRRQIDLYHPWARTFAYSTDKFRDEIENELEGRWQAWPRIEACTDTQNLTKAVKLLKPFKRRFPYPIDKRRTKENVAALRQAEQNLDRFWANFDQNLRQIGGDLSTAAANRLLSQTRALHRTAEWVEPPPRAEAITPAASTQDSDLYKPLSALSFGDTTAPDTKKHCTPRTKIKTRGAANPPPGAHTAQPTPIPNPINAQPLTTIPVDARALKVFRVLFFNPDVTSTPGEISWADFLHAMASTGFAAEKLYGSVWQFQPTRLDVDRAIQFHEPHPKGKISFWVARRHGRRLWRAYGWVGGMFVLRK